MELKNLSQLDEILRDRCIARTSAFLISMNGVGLENIHTNLPWWSLSIPLIDEDENTIEVKEASTFHSTSHGEEESKIRQQQLSMRICMTKEMNSKVDKSDFRVFHLSYRGNNHPIPLSTNLGPVLFGIKQLNWTDLNWTELNWSELNWIELNWTELNWTEMNSDMWE